MTYVGPKVSNKYKGVEIDYNIRVFSTAKSHESTLSQEWIQGSMEPPKLHFSRAPSFNEGIYSFLNTFHRIVTSLAESIASAERI